MILAWILGFSLLASLGGVAGAALILLVPEDPRQRLIRALLAFAVGILLAAALLGLLPRAAATGAPLEGILTAALVAFVGLFAVEKVILWGHSHREEGHDHHHHAHATMGPLVIAGDAVHNFVDGIIIAAAFTTSVPLGVATALAVTAHELPHEVSDFAVLLEAGYSRGRALLMNAAASLTTFVGALLAYLALQPMTETIPYVLGASAASFLYIAIAALIPILHRRNTLGASLTQLALIGAGIGAFGLLHELLHAVSVQ